MPSIAFSFCMWSMPTSRRTFILEDMASHHVNTFGVISLSIVCHMLIRFFNFEVVDQMPMLDAHAIGLRILPQYDEAVHGSYKFIALFASFSLA